METVQPIAIRCFGYRETRAEWCDGRVQAPRSDLRPSLGVARVRRAGRGAGAVDAVAGRDVAGAPPLPQLRRCVVGLRRRAGPVADRDGLRPVQGRRLDAGRRGLGRDAARVRRVVRRSDVRPGEERMVAIGMAVFAELPAAWCARCSPSTPRRMPPTRTACSRSSTACAAAAQGHRRRRTGRPPTSDRRGARRGRDRSGGTRR